MSSPDGRRCKNPAKYWVRIYSTDDESKMYFITMTCHKHLEFCKSKGIEEYEKLND